MNYLKKTDPEIYKAVCEETVRQETSLEMIASENFTYEAVMEAQGSVLTNKYAEGYPTKRWYNGCEHVDVVESLAIERVKKLFGAEAANVQPHSGSSANMAVYFAMLEPGDTVLAMSLDHGGHLTHGHAVNFSGRFFNFIPYGVSKDTEKIDYDELEVLALEHKPKMITSGASAYPRSWDFKRLREIADKVNALLMVDMAHFAGLVAAGYHPNPVPYSDFVTSTTHKTLRGPRGGVILCKEKYIPAINKQVFPGIQGGPLEHVIAAKAVAFKMAMTDDFKSYQSQVQKNAAYLAQKLIELGMKVVSNGTDNHLVLVNVKAGGVSGKDAANRLHQAGITVNKNMIPFDTESPFVTSGIRLGTPALTARKMKESEIDRIASWINEVCVGEANPARYKEIASEVKILCEKFPLYPEYYSKAKEELN